MRFQLKIFSRYFPSGDVAVAVATFSSPPHRDAPLPWRVPFFDPAPLGEAASPAHSYKRRHSAARPKVSGKTAFFPRNDRPYGLKRAAFQTEIALGKILWRAGFAVYAHRDERGGICDGNAQCDLSGERHRRCVLQTYFPLISRCCILVIVFLYSGNYACYTSFSHKKRNKYHRQEDHDELRKQTSLPLHL